MTSRTAVRELDRLADARAQHEAKMRAELALMDRLTKAQERLQAAQDERAVVIAAMVNSGGAAWVAGLLGMREAEVAAIAKSAPSEAAADLLGGAATGASRKRKPRSEPSSAAAAAADEGPTLVAPAEEAPVPALQVAG